MHFTFLKYHCVYKIFLLQWYKDSELLDTTNSPHRLLTLPDGGLFFLSAEPRDSGHYHCVVVDTRTHEEVEISYEAAVTVLSEDEYEDYLDGNVHPEPLDESHEEFNNRETVTKIEDAIKTDGQMDDGKIVMEIEAVAIEKEVVNDGVTKTDIPLVFWVICLSVVSFMTLLVIFGAAFIIFKIKNMKNVTGDIETGGGANVYERPSTKRHSWIETPWSFYPSSTQLKTFRNHSLLHTAENTSNTSNTSSCDYDYASSDYFLLSKAPSENSSKKYIFQSNHYASSNIKS